MIRRRFSALGRDDRGLAVIEFAFLMPVMLLALLGTVEISNLVNSYSKTVSASQTVADLTGQSATLTTADMTGIVAAAQRVLDPLVSDATTLGVEVVSVGFDADNKPTQLWRYAWGNAQASSLTGAQGLGVAGESVVMVTLTYTCVPLIHDIVPQKTFREVSYSRPRLVRKIALNGSTG
jgi:Flp pilus assembly protein TadG